MRLLGSPASLFVTGLASWPVLFCVLAACAWLGAPHVALYLTILILSVGFACCELSALDCAVPVRPQVRRLLSVFCLWILVGAGGLYVWPRFF